MKLKHLAALLMLLAVGCSKQPSSDKTAPPADSSSSSKPAASSSIEPGTETQLASNTVSFDVTGMLWPSGWGGKIKAALAELPGVTVDEVTKGSVTCSGENLDQAAIIAAIKGAGFGATVANWYRDLTIAE